MPEFRARGASVLSLSPQLYDFAEAWAREDGITFDVLIDLANGVARTYGLVFPLPAEIQKIYRNFFRIDLDRFNGDSSWDLALPATYVIAHDGNVAYANADADYTRRPEPTELLDALDAMN